MKTLRPWISPLFVLPFAMLSATMALAQSNTPLPFAASQIRGGGYAVAPASYSPESDPSYMAMAGTYANVPGGPGMPAAYPGMMPTAYPGMAQGGMQQGGMMPGGMMPYGGAPAGFQSPYGPEGANCDPNGQYSEGDGGDYCPDCGQGRRRGRDLIDFILPCGEGGMCAPRYFDISVDAVNFVRDKVSRPVNFESNGVGGPIVLGTNNLSLSNSWGFRGTAAYQVSPGGSLEFTYLGTFNFSSSATVTSAGNNLYSALSNFGQQAIFADTDRAFQSALSYSSGFNSYELNYRRRWVGRDCRLQGSWIGGLRFFDLNDHMVYTTNTTIGNMIYGTGTSNNLTGFQIGGDSWLTIIPGLRIGAEAKAGIYGNRATQSTNIFSGSLNQNFTESVSRDTPSFLGELGVMGIYKINYHWTMRVGYQFLYGSSMALATENFNKSPPNLFVPVNPARVSNLNDGGSVFYHGLTFGVEYMW